VARRGWKRGQGAEKPFPAPSDELVNSDGSDRERSAFHFDLQLLPQVEACAPEPEAGEADVGDAAAGLLAAADGQRSVAALADFFPAAPLVLAPGFGLDRLGDVAGEGDGFDGCFAVDLGVLFEGFEALFGHSIAAGLIEQVEQLGRGGTVTSVFAHGE